MTFARRLRAKEDGLTLVELMASVAIFAVMTVGITPVLVSSVRGSAVSRSLTVGKNIGVNAMERVRGLPFFVSDPTKKVDVLDLYFPDLTVGSPTGYAPGSAATAYTYTTTCTPTTTPSRSCPAGIPAGYTVKYAAQFVQADTGADYTPVAPPTGYVWNSSVNDKPPTLLLRMSITTSWTVGATAKSYKLTSLLGDRKIGADKVAAEARVDYLVQVLASYKDSSGRISDLSLQAGVGQAKGENRLLPRAEITARSLKARLTRQPNVLEADATQIGTLDGATSIFAAPPDVDPGAPATPDAAHMTHPDLAGVPRVAGLQPSTTSALKAKVANGLPVAAGSFALNTNSSTFDFWVNNQADVSPSNALQLGADALSPVNDPNRPIVGLRRPGSTSLSGSTSVETTALGAGRKVQAIATGTFGQLGLFPVNFIAAGNPEGRTAVQVNNFTATTNCNSTATASASGQATYSATVRYWAEKDWTASNQFGNNVTEGEYKSIPVSNTQASDPLAAVNPSPANNPLVWEDPSDGNVDSIGGAKDIYLFPIHHDHGPLGLIKHDHPGYLAPSEGWSSAFGIPSSTPGTNGGRVTSAKLGGVIRINSVPLDPSVPETNVSIAIGSLSCTASDLR